MRTLGIPVGCRPSDIIGLAGTPAPEVPIRGRAISASDPVIGAGRINIRSWVVPLWFIERPQVDREVSLACECSSDLVH